MLHRILILAFIALSSPAYAQTGSVAKINLQDFDFVVAKITANYAGFDTKVTDATRPSLTALTQRLRVQVPTASDAEMESILREWVGFFQDGHTHVTYSTGASRSNAAPRRAPWTEPQLRQRLLSLGNNRDPVEGIWRIGGGRYRVGVLRTDTKPEAFTAVVLSTTAEGWAPKDVKAEIRRGSVGYSVVYRAGDRSVRILSARLASDDAVLDLGHEYGVWMREWPAVANADALTREWPADELGLTRLSVSTWWLRIPDFGDDRAKPLRELVAQHEADFASAQNLLIDLRNNAGGSDYVYQPLLPLLYTRPIYSIDVEMRSSPDNILLRQQVAELLRKDNPEGAALLEAQNLAMAAHPGAYIQPEARPFSAYVAPVVRPSPRHIAVLIDGAASTGEQFILDARQSRKVTLFGYGNSAGILDYANVVAMTSPSGRVHLQWATSRSLRLPDDPVDPNGVAPDIVIPQSERDPVSYVQAWLERQVD